MEVQAGAADGIEERLAQDLVVLDREQRVGAMGRELSRDLRRVDAPRSFERDPQPLRRRAQRPLPSVRAVVSGRTHHEDLVAAFDHVLERRRGGVALSAENEAAHGRPPASGLESSAIASRSISTT